MRTFFLLLFFILTSSQSFADLDFMETLSQGAYIASQRKICPEFNATLAGEALKRQSDISCGFYKSENINLKNWSQKAQNSVMADKAEDDFFKNLALDYIPELECGAKFASNAAKSPETIADIQDKLETMRRLWNEQQSIKKICPKDMALMPKSATAEDKAICQRKNNLYVAIESIKSLIPLSGTQTVSVLINEILSVDPAVRAKPLISSVLKSKIMNSYSEAAKNLKNQAASMKKTVLTKGGAGFKRSTRRVLASDPLLVKKLVDRSGNDKNVSALACSVDARYGKGAEALDFDIMMGSMLLTAGAGLAANTTRTVAGIAGARALGMSMTTARVLQYSALVVNSTLAAKQISKACYSDKSIKFKVGTQNSCVTVPSFEEIKNGNCELNWLLGALGVAAPFANSQIKLAGLKNTVVPSTTLEKLFGTKKPPQHMFTKGSPIYAYKITSDNPNDIPEGIRKYLGAVDKTTYTKEFLKENMGSVIAIQMKGDQPDFYIIGKNVFNEQYRVATAAKMAETNGKYAASVNTHIASLAAQKDPNLLIVMKSTKVPMFKMSDLGYKVNSSVTIESPWGTQTKPAGADAFLVFDKTANKYYMVNTGPNGLPLSYEKAP